MRAHTKAGLLGSSAAAVALGLASGASGDGAPTTGQVSSPLSTPSADPDRPTTVQEIHFAVAQEVPGFGGFWVDPEQPDRLKVWLTDPSTQLGPAKTALRLLLGDYPALDTEKIDALPARFGFLELAEWHHRLLGVVASYPGWISLDTQEMANQLWIGVEDDSTRAEIERLLPELGIPEEAVEFRIEQIGDLRNCPQAPDELTDCRRPVLGGFEIQGEMVGGAPLGKCTLGFLARRNGVQGLVTASHCTQYRFYPDSYPNSSEFHQPAIDNRIGVEVVDPAPVPYVGGCPGSYVCRWSDAAWIRLDSSVSADQGWIARPENGSAAWHGGLFGVKGVKGSYVGMDVFKVGKRTGLTEGTVTQTNTDRRASTPYFPNAMLLDQHYANFWGDQGDSGGPVLTFTESNNGLDVYLVGIHWGGDPSPGSNSFYSDVQYAQWQYDLGALDVVVPPSGGGGR